MLVIANLLNGGPNMKWIYDTGGREKYYKALNVKDCVTRAIAIANGMDYKETYMALKKYMMWVA